MQALDIAFRNW